MFCKTCGTQIAENGKCPNCGRVASPTDSYNLANKVQTEQKMLVRKPAKSLASCAWFAPVAVAMVFVCKIIGDLFANIQIVIGRESIYLPLFRGESVIEMLLGCIFSFVLMLLAFSRRKNAFKFTWLSFLIPYVLGEAGYRLAYFIADLFDVLDPQIHNHAFLPNAETLFYYAVILTASFIANALLATFTLWAYYKVLDKALLQK